MLALRTLYHQCKFLRSTRCGSSFWVAPTRRDFDLSQKRYSSVPKLFWKEHVFGYSSATTGPNLLRFVAVATFDSILTENRQAKPGRFQTRSLKHFSCCIFYTLEIVLKIRFFHQEIFILQFSVVPNGFNSSVRRFNNFILGTSLFSITTFDVISLRSIGSSTQVYVYKRKSKEYSFNLFRERFKKVLAEIVCFTKLNNKIFGRL